MKVLVKKIQSKIISTLNHRKKCSLIISIEAHLVIQGFNLSTMATVILPIIHQAIIMENQAKADNANA